jgi:hypothetical protein
MSFNQLISVNNGAPNGSRNRQWSNSIINGLFYRFKNIRLVAARCTPDTDRLHVF